MPEALTVGGAQPNATPTVAETTGKRPPLQSFGTCERPWQKAPSSAERGPDSFPEQLSPSEDLSEAMETQDLVEAEEE